MKAPGTSPVAQPGVWIPLRFALRELRGGLRGFYVFIACIALGCLAIAGVSSIAASLDDGLAREGQSILGGDISFSLIQREAAPNELAALKDKGIVSTAATTRAMLRTGGDQATLVELKAVDAAYPLYGKAVLDPAGSLQDALAERDGVFGAVADPSLLSRLNIKPGTRAMIGNARIEIRAALTSEPDKLAGGIGFGPRLILGTAALRATGLIQPGSLIRWTYRMRLSNSGETSVAAVTRDVRAQLPDAGWEIRNRTNASPQLERNVNRFTQFLTIVGLTALLVGGVGVGNAVKSHLDRRHDTIATMKALGASGRRVFAIYLTQVILLALIGGAIGAVLGAILPFAVSGLVGKLMPLPIVPSFHPAELALSLVYGLLTALAFAMWPLGRAHDVPVGALFRDAIGQHGGRPRAIYVALTVIAGLALAATAILLAYDRRVAVIYVGAAAGIFLLLRLVASLVMTIAARVPRPRSTSLRMAIANIHRPGALTPTIVLSLGLGIALLVTVIEIDANLQKQFANELPAKAPSFYFLDIPSEQTDGFTKFIRREAPDALLEEVPMLRGRIVSARRIAAEDIKPSDDAAWVLQSDRGITYSDEIPPGSRLAGGEWWPRDYSGPPLVSFEKKIADGLGLKIGDSVTVNVLGRNISATIANLRVVDWQSLSINFVMVFSPNTFRGAPHTQLATVTYPNGGSAEQEARLVRGLAAEFPMVTSVRVKDALETIGGLITNLVLGIRGASAITLLAAALVLGGALAAGHRHRVYDAVILKTLGATRLRLIGAYAIEYLLLGSATAVFGVLSGSLAAWLIVVNLMNLRFVWLPLPALGAALAALAVTVVLGLAGTFSALGQKPAPILRNL